MKLSKTHTSFGKINKKDNLNETAIATRLKPETPHFGKAVHPFEEDDEDGGKKKRRANSKKLTPSQDQHSNNIQETNPEDINSN